MADTSPNDPRRGAPTRTRFAVRSNVVAGNGEEDSSPPAAPTASSDQPSPPPREPISSQETPIRPDTGRFAPIGIAAANPDRACCSCVLAVLAILVSVAVWVFVYWYNNAEFHPDRVQPSPTPRAAKSVRTNRPATPASTRPVQ